MSTNIPKCCAGGDHSSDYRVRFFDDSITDDDARQQCGSKRLEKYVCEGHLAEVCTDNSFKTENNDRVLDIYGGGLYTSVKDALAKENPLCILSPRESIGMASQ